MPPHKKTWITDLAFTLGGDEIGSDVAASAARPGPPADMHAAAPHNPKRNTSRRVMPVAPWGVRWVSIFSASESGRHAERACYG
jgi:hypothetical protein